MTARWIHAAAIGVSSALVLAWPWELFQQIPGVNITIVKLCGAALIALAAADAFVRRSWNIPRTGLELPLGALMLIGLISVAWSADQSASLALLARYTVYIVTFYAIAWAVRSVEDAALLSRLFMWSAGAVAVCAVLASLGVLAPVFAEYARQIGRRVAWDTETGSLVRIAATSPDFNQGVLTFLLSFPVALWLLYTSEATRFRAAVRWSLVVLLIGGMAVAFSRSAIGITAILLAACGVQSAFRGHLTRRLIAYAIMASLVFSVIAAPYIVSLAGRIARGLEGNEASIAHRVYVYQLALDLLPDYWLLGTGINASDAVILSLADPEKSGGQTLHSVPFKFLLETGIFGLAVYLWLWIQGTWILWKRYAGHPSTQPFAWATLAAAFSLFAMTSVQPFMMLSIYPVLLGIAFGPRLDAESATAQARAAWPLVIAAAAVLAVVAPNYVGYQRLAHQTAQYANAMEGGLQHERRGEWNEADASYAAAAGTAPGESSYFPFAADVTGLEFLFEDAALLRAAPNPRAAALYATGRAQSGAGNLNDAAEAVNAALTLEAEYAAAYFLLGEIEWSRRNYADALSAFAEAADKAKDAANLPYRERMVPKREAKTADDFILEAERQRTLGNWAAVRACVETALRFDPHNPHGLYLLGIDAEMKGDRDTAIQYYQACLATAPQHESARESLEALQEP